MPNKLVKQTFTAPYFGIYSQPSAPGGLTPSLWKQMHNCSLTWGMPQLRPGRTPINTTAFGSGAGQTVHGLGLYQGATRELLVACGPLVQKTTIPPGEPASITTSVPTGSGWTSRTGSRTVFSQLGSELYIVNGVDGNLRYNGTTMRKMGLKAPSSLSAPALSAGALTLTRLYLATFTDGNSDLDDESNGQATATSVTYAGQRGTFTAPTVSDSDPQITHWNLYGRHASGTYYRVNNAPVTLATTIEDNLADATLINGRLLPDQTKSIAPHTSFNWLVEHQSRLVGVFADNENILRWSDIGSGTGGVYFQPEWWPTANFLAFPPTGGLELTGAVSFFEWLVIFQPYGVWAHRGTLGGADAEIFKLFAVEGQRGTGVPYLSNIIVNEDSIYFAAKDGIYRISRAAVGAEGTTVTGGSTWLQVKRVSSHIDELYRDIDYSQGAAAVYDRDYQRWILFGQRS